MRFKGLDLNLLVVLNSVLEERSITLAARRLGLSQSATSSALNRLRDYFSDELIERLGRTMALTPLGESLAAPVRAALLQIDSAVLQRDDFDPLQCTRRFTIVTADGTCNAMIAAGVRMAAERAPHVTFDFLLPGDIIADPSGPSFALERGQIDLLITPEAYAARQQPWRALWQDSLLVMCCQTNPLARGVLTRSAYLNASHVCVQFGRERHMPLDAMLRSRQLNRRIDVMVPCMEMAMPFIVDQDRLITIPETFAQRCESLYPVRRLRTELDLPSLTMGIQWHDSRTNDPALQWLIGIIESALRDRRRRCMPPTHHSTLPSDTLQVVE